MRRGEPSVTASGPTMMGKSPVGNSGSRREVGMQKPRCTTSVEQGSIQCSGGGGEGGGGGGGGKLPSPPPPPKKFQLPPQKIW